MSGFAICRTNNETDVTIEGVHINLWVLQSGSRIPTVYYDLGIRFCTAKDEKEVALEVHLPFSYSDYDDLQSKLVDNDTASLIFGERVSYVEGKIVFSSGETLTLVQVREISESEKKHKASAVAKITFPFVSAANGSHYARVRFKTTDASKIYQPKYSGLRTNGALIDIRINDPRDWLAPNAMPPDKLVLSVGRTQVFVIAPAAYQQRSSSPPLQYMRSLEAGYWDDYVGRALSRPRSDKFLIYYWKVTTPATPETPARFFLDLSRDFGYLPFANAFRVALILLPVYLLLSALDVSGWIRGEVLRQAPSGPSTLLQKIPQLLTSAGVLAFIAWLGSAFKHSRTAYDWWLIARDKYLGASEVYFEHLLTARTRQRKRKTKK